MIQGDLQKKGAYINCSSFFTLEIEGQVKHTAL